jgi:hypothetical protein
MDKSISFNFRLRKSNRVATAFAESFFQDIGKCFSRFKVAVTMLENQPISSDNHVFIFLTMQDFEDREFIKEVTTLADVQNVYIVNLDPLRAVDKGFPIHKFKTFSFWDEVKETQEIRLFRRGALENNAIYWEKITDIALEIIEKYVNKVEVKKGKVFLAQTDNAQSSDRDNLQRDLIEMEYEVSPDRLFSMDFYECTEQIKHEIEGAKLIIHPIPLIYSRYFTDKSISLVEHQCNISSLYAANKQKEVTRIIWIPSDFEVSDEENQIFVEKIQRDQDQSKNTLVLKVTLEELKKIYKRILTGEDTLKLDGQLPDVYIVADSDEERVGEMIKRSSTTADMEVKANFKGITYNQHLRYLANSQIVVINYTSDNEPWLTMKVNDIYKSKGMGLSKPFVKLILVKDKRELDTTNFENRFSEVHVCSLVDLKLNLSIRNN